MAGQSTYDNNGLTNINIFKNQRPILTEKDLREKYSFSKIPANDALKGSINYVTKRYKPSPICMLNFLYDRIPFIKWIQTYDMKTNLLKDIIAGLTIGKSLIYIIICLI
jgi:hypothetical protein